MATTIKLVNKMNQGLNILLKTEKGKMVSAVIPARGSKEINEYQMSQDVADKVARKYLLVETKVNTERASDDLKVTDGARVNPGMVGDLNVTDGVRTGDAEDLRKLREQKARGTEATAEHIPNPPAPLEGTLIMTRASDAAQAGATSAGRRY